jgi:hypothetical protein
VRADQAVISQWLREQTMPTRRPTTPQRPSADRRLRERRTAG